jgi:hypothetical protein
MEAADTTYECVNPPANNGTESVPVTDCERCGREAAVVIDGKGWCVDCFHECGSCCAGEE